MCACVCVSVHVQYMYMYIREKQRERVHVHMYRCKSKNSLQWSLSIRTPLKSLLIKILLIKTLYMIIATATISLDMNGRVCGALVQFVCY